VGDHDVDLACEQIVTLDVSQELHGPFALCRGGEEFTGLAYEFVALARFGTDGEYTYARGVHTVGALDVGTAQVRELHQHLRVGAQPCCGRGHDPAGGPGRHEGVRVPAADESASHGGTGAWPSPAGQGPLVHRQFVLGVHDGDFPKGFLLGEYPGDFGALAHEHDP